MLRESFIFLPGVQEKSERRIWQAGIVTWDHLLEAKSVPGVSRERLSFWKTRIRLIQEIMHTQQGLYELSRMLGTRYAWRAYKEVMHNPRFVDIETTEYRNDITVVGVSDGEFYQAFIKGRNLDARALHTAFAGASCIITFNGSSFDLPIIERNYPGILPNVPHLDLRHICSQAGLRGGLKRIERHLGIQRPEAIRENSGADAIMLWYRHVLGDEEALRDLVDYNAADVLNLAPLMALVIPALWKQTRHDTPLPFPRTSLEMGWDEDSRTAL
jgi:uncharacterized protein